MINWRRSKKEVERKKWTKNCKRKWARELAQREKEAANQANQPTTAGHEKQWPIGIGNWKEEK
jgi:hypothetical protein